MGTKSESGGGSSEYESISIALSVVPVQPSPYGRRRQSLPVQRQNRGRQPRRREQQQKQRRERVVGQLLSHGRFLRDLLDREYSFLPFSFPAPDMPSKTPNVLPTEKPASSPPQDTFSGWALTCNAVVSVSCKASRRAISIPPRRSTSSINTPRPCTHPLRSRCQPVRLRCQWIGNSRRMR